ncbi:MAG: pilus assembly protein PilM [Planctomycetia bacterium]|nr:pilus assembly protein PilM [Planctomycetia bacterium]
MARSNAVWGIDVGNCSLKAMRCYIDDADPTRLVADAIDYIEYPMILTQPEANPDELIREALKQFLERNSIRNDKIAISIAGQNGLVRFIKLPPIEAKKIPDIVRYEAKQQIPFNLNEVIWDYQRLGQSGDSAFPLEVEIGLFAMKRDQAFHILEPYEDVDIPVDLVQLAPLALYNYMMVDEMKDLPSADDYDPENPPPYVVVLSMGTDATDLILTNGFRVWQRNLPIGGNHFTKALMKELKLTFAKADHLKRNLTTSQDKVAVLKAMQPVFNNFQNEIQRSLGFHSSLDPNAQYDRVIALGSAMKLTGLTKYLSQNLGIAVHLATSFHGLDTVQLADSAVVKDNLPSFGICYGLCLQGLRRATVRTNLLPSEIRTARIINSKKPWMVAAVSLLMLGAVVSYGAHVGIQKSVSPKDWQSAESSATSVASTAAEDETKVKAAEEAFTEVDKIGKNLIGNVEKRLLWLELIRGINECLPVPPVQDPQQVPTSESIRNRKELHIVNIEAQALDANATDQWFEKMLKERWLQISGIQAPEEGAEGEGAEGGEASEVDMTEIVAKALAPDIPGVEGEEAVAATVEGEDGEQTGPKRWLVSVSGYHFHNGRGLEVERADFVRDTFIRNLEEKQFTLPQTAVLSVVEGTDVSPDSEASEGSEELPEGDSDEAARGPELPSAENAENGGGEVVTMRDLGVRYPVLVNPGKTRSSFVLNPYLKDTMESRSGMAGMEGRPPMMAGGGPNPEGAEEEKKEDISRIEVERFDFVIHFIWEPKTPTERARIRELKAAAAKAAAELAAAETEEGAEENGEQEGDEE